MPVSIDKDGSQASVDFIYYISEDGRYIAFTSDSNNIVEGDTNSINRGPFERGHAADVFLLDRETNQYERVSLRHNGGQIEDGVSFVLSASNNLDRLLYRSDGISQFPNDTRIANWDYDIDLYIYDKPSKQITWLTVSPDGSEGDFETSIGNLSGDGRYVVVYSLASNYLADDSPYNSQQQFILFDTETNNRELISKGMEGTQQNASHNRNRFSSAINYDGHYVVFFSYATNLTEDGVGGLFLWDRETKATGLISREPNGSPIQFEEFFEPEFVDMSDDGRYIFFISPSNQHVLNDPHPTEKTGYDGFIYDRITKQTKIVPLGEFDSPGYLRGASVGSMSANGQYIIFTRRVNSGSNEFPELYLYDQFSDKVELLLSEDMNHPLIPSPNIFGIPRITSNGKHILFSSRGVLYLMTRDVSTSHVDGWEEMK